MNSIHLDSHTCAPPNKPGTQQPETPAETHHDVDNVGSPPPVPKVGLIAVALFGLLAVGTVAGAYTVGLRKHQEEMHQIHLQAERMRNAKPLVQVTTARRAESDITTTLPGDVRADEETTVYARTTGYLKRWHVDIGDQVQEGDLLAEIDTPEVDQQFLQAQAQVGQLAATLKTAEATARLAESTFQRYANLVDTGAVTAQEYDERLSNRDKTQAAVDAAKAELAAGEANLQRLRQLKEFSRVYAPFSGTITRRWVDSGQLVTTGSTAAQPLFQITRTDPVRVFVHVPQIYAPGIQRGLTAEITVRERANETFTGTVSRTAGAIDPETRTLLTEIRVPNPDGRLLTGSYVQVKLAFRREAPPVLVPESALIFDADGTRVAVLDDHQRIRFQPVVIERNLGSEVGIRSGLEPGTRIVVNPGTRLREGQEVTIATNEEQ